MIGCGTAEGIPQPNSPDSWKVHHCTYACCLVPKANLSVNAWILTTVVSKSAHTVYVHVNIGLSR